jgi:hypothetical protein
MVLANPTYFMDVMLSLGVDLGPCQFEAHMLNLLWREPHRLLPSFHNRSLTAPNLVIFSV